MHIVTPDAFHTAMNLLCEMNLHEAMNLLSTHCYSRRFPNTGQLLIFLVNLLIFFFFNSEKNCEFRFRIFLDWLKSSLQIIVKKLNFPAFKDNNA